MQSCLALPPRSQAGRVPLSAPMRSPAGSLHGALAFGSLTGPWRARGWSDHRTSPLEVRLAPRFRFSVETPAFPITGCGGSGHRIPLPPARVCVVAVCVLWDFSGLFSDVCAWSLKPLRKGAREPQLLFPTPSEDSLASASSSWEVWADVAGSAAPG